jgi:hypothetical protein
MPNVIAVLRSTTAGSRPAGKIAGEPWANFADKQFGVHDGTVANDLLAVRLYSQTGGYVVGDHVVQAGILYRCITPVPAPSGAFVLANWEVIGASSFDQAAADLLYVSLAGDTMTGPLLLPVLAPAAATEATHKQYVDDTTAAAVADYLPLAGGTVTGPITLAGDPTAVLHAAPQQYVDAGDAVLQAQVDLLASNLLFTGSLNVVTDVGNYTPESQMTDGALPVAAAGNTNFYVIVSTGGTALATGNIPAGDYALGDWLVSDGATWTRLPLGQAVLTADSISIVVPGQPTWTDIQLAIEGLETNKVNRAGDTMTGPLLLPAANPTGLQAVHHTYVHSAILDAGVYT